MSGVQKKKKPSLNTTTKPQKPHRHASSIPFPRRHLPQQPPSPPPLQGGEEATTVTNPSKSTKEA